MFWRENPGKKYYYSVIMKMKIDYMVTMLYQDIKKEKGALYLKTN